MKQLSSMIVGLAWSGSSTPPMPTPPDKSKGPAQIARLKAYLNTEVVSGARMLLVTHGSLITALTGIYTSEAEMVIVKANGKGDVTVIGRGVP